MIFLLSNSHICDHNKKSTQVEKLIRKETQHIFGSEHMLLMIGAQQTSYDILFNNKFNIQSMAEKVQQLVQGNNVTLQSTILPPSINDFNNQQESNSSKQPSPQFQMIDESIIENKNENYQISVFSECNNIGDDPSESIEHIGDGSIMEASFYEKQERVQISCLFFDLKENRTLSYKVELNNNNIPEVLQSVFEDVGEIFDEVIREQQYELQEGAINFKYLVTSKKGKITKTKKYRLAMEKITLNKEQQLSHLVSYLKKKISLQVQNHELDKQKRRKHFQEIQIALKQEIAKIKSVHQEERVGYEKKVSELNKICSESYTIILNNKWNAISLTGRIKQDEAQRIFQRKTYLNNYYKEVLMKDISHEMCGALQQLLIFNNMVFCDQPLLKESITSSYFLKSREYKLLNNYFKQNTKTQIQIYILQEISKYGGVSLKIYGFHRSNQTKKLNSRKFIVFDKQFYLISGLKKGDIIIIEVDRFLNKVLVLVNGASKVSDNLNQYVTDRQFKIDIRLEFDDSVSIKADIRRSDFLIETNDY